MMTDEECREKRRAAKARAKARDPEKWLRQHREQERRRQARLKSDPVAYAADREYHREATRRWKAEHPTYYAANRERILEANRQRRRLRGAIPLEELREQQQRVKLERQLAKEAARAKKLAASRQRKLERYRKHARLYRMLHPERKREQDRRYRANNKEKARAAEKIRKERAKARGYRWMPSAKARERHREYSRAQNVLVTAAHQYLISVGVAEWWGPRDTTQTRRKAAFHYAKENGLLPKGE